MNLLTNPLVFICSLWILYMNYGVTESNLGHKARINVGFIRDIDAISIKRANTIAILLSQDPQHNVEISPFENETKISDCFSLSTSVCSLLLETIFTIIGAADVTSYEVLEAYGQAMKVPIIIYNDVRKFPNKNFSYLLNIVPSYLKPIVDYVKFYKWKTVYFLHENSDNMWPLRASEFYSLIDDAKLLAIQRSLSFPYHSYEQLRQLDHLQLPPGQTEKVFIIDISGPYLQILLRQIMELGMNREGYHYILGGLDIKSIELGVFVHGGARITGFQVFTNPAAVAKLMTSWVKQESRSERSPPPLTCLFSSRRIKKVYAKEDPGFFRTRAGTHWNTDKVREVSCHRRTSLSKGPILIDYLKTTTYQCITDWVSFDENGQRKNYSLDVYSLYRKPLEKIGNWHSDRGYTETAAINKRKPDDPYIVTLVVEPPFIINKTGENGTEIFEGYCIDLFKKIANSSHLKLKYVIRKRNDLQYGKFNKTTEEWDGMISELINGEADIALGSITITESRQKWVDFTKPFMNTGISIMIKRPDKQKPNVFSFKEPFSNKMWVCIMFGFAGVSLVLVLIGRFSPYEWRDMATPGPTGDFSILNSLWYSFGALLQQGSDFLPSSVSGRIAECAWWFFTLIIVSSYTANLAAFLTIEKLNIPIDSADALAAQSKIKYGFKEGGATNDFFEKSQVEVFQKMFQFIKTTVPSPNVLGNKEGWERVIKGKGEYAYLLESTSNEYYNQQKPCKTMKVGSNLNQNGYGIATKKDSPLSRKLNLALLELIERGELINLKQRWWYDKGQCGTVAAAVGKRSLSLSNVAGSFHIVIMGLVLAMIFSALEFAYHYRRKQFKRKKVIKTVLITDNGIEEEKPLKTPNVNGTENKGYQTTANSPANLIMFESVTEDGSTML